jgi:hypothetical protein
MNKKLDELDTKILLNMPEARANKKLAAFLIEQNMLTLDGCQEVLRIHFNTNNRGPAERGAQDATEYMRGVKS